MENIRLNKFLAERLGVSRREADNIISSGKVKIDENTAVIGDRLDKNSKVCYNGRIIEFEKTFTYLMLNKPVNYVCSRKRQGDSHTIYEILPKEYKNLKTVGRLDKNSSGLIILTDDGDFSFKMAHPSFKKNKIYRIKIDRPLMPLHQQMIADFGVNLEDGVSKLGLMSLDDTKELWQVQMSEGRNRQIRRTFMALGYRVVELHREVFGKYQLGNLKIGEFQKISV